MKAVIAITMGDAAGVGPEVVAKAYGSCGLFGLCRPLLVGSADVLRQTIKSLRLSLRINAIKSIRDGVAKANPVRKKLSNGVYFQTSKNSIPAQRAGLSNGAKVINIIDLKNIRLSALKKGKPSVMCGRASIDYIKEATALALSGEVDAIVTCPINKEAVLRAGFRGGHTELLSKLTHTRSLAMMLASGEMRVVPLTRHIPLKNVSRLITKKRILEILKLINSSAMDFGLSQPTIAVLGLNPHCGDGGLSGREEGEKIVPAIRRAKRAGYRVEGPFSADGFFGSGAWKGYDFILVMYHDQGLIPFKMRAFGSGVNVTLGLPIIRTSVDHGTGYDIAGKGEASERSLVEAVKMAAEIVRRRKEWRGSA